MNWRKKSTSDRADTTVASSWLWCCVLVGFALFALSACFTARHQQRLASEETAKQKKEADKRAALDAMRRAQASLRQARRSVAQKPVSKPKRKMTPQPAAPARREAGRKVMPPRSRKVVVAAKALDSRSRKASQTPRRLPRPALEEKAPRPEVRKLASKKKDCPENKAQPQKTAKVKPLASVTSESLLPQSKQFAPQIGDCFVGRKDRRKLTRLPRPEAKSRLTGVRGTKVTRLSGTRMQAKPLLAKQLGAQRQAAAKQKRAATEKARIERAGKQKAAKKAKALAEKQKKLEEARARVAKRQRLHRRHRRSLRQPRFHDGMEAHQFPPMFLAWAGDEELYCRTRPSEDAPEVKRVVHMQPLFVKKRRGSFAEVKLLGQNGATTCYFPRQKLRRYRYKRKRCASNRRLQRVPFVSMRKLITPESWSAFEHFVAIRKQRGLERKERRKRWRRWRRSRSYRRWKRRKGKKRYPRWLRVKRKKIERPDGVFRWRLKWLGRLFPTYYVIAVEDEFPAPRAGRNRRLHPVPVYDKDGKVLAVVSRVFRRQLYIQGTGILRDGRVLNYHSRHRRHIRFVVLPAGSYGLGIKEYALMPYRSVAIDFRELARRVRFPLSRAKQLVGQLLYIPRLRRALLPNGRRHDGYICAVDIGSAIRRDRIDIFVGLEGGGNPYALPCRHHNAFSRHGVESLNPMDWPTRRKRRRGYGLADRYEYRKTAKHKALKIFVVPGAKCRQKPYTNLTKLDTRTAD